MIIWFTAPLMTVFLQRESSKCWKFQVGTHWYWVNFRGSRLKPIFIRKEERKDKY